MSGRTVRAIIPAAAVLEFNWYPGIAAGRSHQGVSTSLVEIQLGVSLSNSVADLPPAPAVSKLKVELISIETSPLAKPATSATLLKSIDAVMTCPNKSGGSSTSFSLTAHARYRFLGSSFSRWLSFLDRGGAVMRQPGHHQLFSRPPETLVGGIAVLVSCGASLGRPRNILLFFEGYWPVSLRRSWKKISSSSPASESLAVTMP